MESITNTTQRDLFNPNKYKWKFTNLMDPKTNIEIQKLCKNKSGIYCIYNTISKKTYIGRGATIKQGGNRIYMRY